MRNLPYFAGLLLLASSLCLVMANHHRNGDIDGSTLTPANLADLLHTAGWRNAHEINSMSDEDKRNTIIVELNKRTTESIQALQGRDNHALIAAGGLLLILRKNEWRNDDGMRRMSIEDLRNTCIVELHNKGFGGIGFLQGHSNSDLVKKAAEYYRKTIELSKVISMQLHFDRVKIAKQQPRVLAFQDFDNSGSREVLRHTLSFSEESTEEEWLSYSDERFGEMCRKASVSFEVMSPFFKIGASAGLEVKTGAKATWKTDKRSTKKVAIRSENRVEVSPGNKLRVELILMMAEARIPFTMVVETKTGQRKTITGEYHNVRAYNQTVKQRSID